MIKQDEFLNPHSCLNKAAPDEQLFVLLGRDVAAPTAIRAWARMRVMLKKNAFTDTQIQDAFNTADVISKLHGLPIPLMVDPGFHPQSDPQPSVMDEFRPLIEKLIGGLIAKNSSLWVRVHVTRKYPDIDDEALFTEYDPPMQKIIQARDFGDMEEMLSGTNMSTTFGERLHVIETMDELQEKLGIEVL